MGTLVTIIGLLLHHRFALAFMFEAVLILLLECICEDRLMSSLLQDLRIYVCPIQHVFNRPLMRMLLDWFHPRLVVRYELLFDSLPLRRRVRGLLDLYTSPHRARWLAALVRLVGLLLRSIRAFTANR